MYHRKSLVSFVVLICSSKLDEVNELLLQTPTFSLYQLHVDDANENSLKLVLRVNAASPTLRCETTFVHIHQSVNGPNLVKDIGEEENKPNTRNEVSRLWDLKSFYAHTRMQQIIVPSLY